MDLETEASKDTVSQSIKKGDNFRTGAHYTWKCVDKFLCILGRTESCYVGP